MTPNPIHSLTLVIYILTRAIFNCSHSLTLSLAILIILTLAILSLTM